MHRPIYKYGLIITMTQRNLNERAKIRSLKVKTQARIHRGDGKSLTSKDREDPKEGEEERLGGDGRG